MEYKKLYRKNNKITNKEEAEANERAAQILMPEGAIIELAKLTEIIKLVKGEIDIDLLWLDYLSKKFHQLKLRNWQKLWHQIYHKKLLAYVLEKKYMK